MTLTLFGKITYSNKEEIRMGSASYNSKALEHMRRMIADHEEFQSLDIVDQVVVLDLIEIAIAYYLEGCLIHTNQDPGAGKLQ